MNMVPILQQTCPTEVILEYTDILYDDIMRLSPQKEEKVLTSILEKTELFDILSFVNSQVGIDKVVLIIMDELKRNPGAPYFGLHFHDGHYYSPSFGNVRTLTSIEAGRYVTDILKSEDKKLVQRTADIDLDRKMLYRLGVMEEQATFIMSLDPKIKELFKTQLIVAHALGKKEVMDEVQKQIEHVDKGDVI